MILKNLLHAVYLVKVLTIGYKRYRLVLCCKLSCALLGYYFKTNIIKGGYHHDLMTKCIHRNSMTNIEQNICSQHLCSMRVKVACTPTCIPYDVDLDAKGFSYMICD